MSDNQQSDTPRTDAWLNEQQEQAEYSFKDFARTLELELSAANARADLWRTRCKEAQRCLGRVMCAYTDGAICTSHAWDVFKYARDTGKDE